MAKTPFTGYLPEITIYTKGVVDPKNRVGGYGYVMDIKGFSDSKSGSETDTTANRMELMAAITAIERLPQPFQVTIISNSKYLTETFDKDRIILWRVRDWSSGLGAPAKNADLWKRFLQACEQHDMRYIWKGGDSASSPIARCTQLAREAFAEAWLQPTIAVHGT